MLRVTSRAKCYHLKNVLTSATVLRNQQCRFYSKQDSTLIKELKKMMVESTDPEILQTSEKLMAVLNKNKVADAGTVSQKAHRETIQGFLQPYNDPADLVGNFCNYVDRVSGDWMIRDKKAPVFPLIQSSGWGKSRLIKEVAQTRYTVYLSFAAPESTAYPPRSALADCLISTNTSEKEALMERFLYGTFMQLITDANNNITPSEWYSKFIDNKDLHEINKSLGDLSLGNFSKEQWMELVERVPNHITNILFAIDEASGFMKTDRSYYRAFRRKLAEVAEAVHPHFKLCSVLSDTSSTIQELAPPDHLDPSWRINFKGQWPPYYLLTTMDATAKAKKSALFGGRPLWSTFGGASSTLACAKKKLSNGITTDKSRVPLTWLACIGCRYTLNPAYITLVANYMGTCIFVSDNREQIQVRYPSEPILAEAAAHNLYPVDEYIAVLNKLQAHTASSFMDDKGERGELVSRMYFSRMFDECVEFMESNVCFSTSHIPLEKFLHKISANITVPDKLQQGTVRFTHWTQLHYAVTHEVLEKAYGRGVALVVQKNEFGRDEIIPIRISNKDGFQYSAIMIQIKNLDKQTSMTVGLSELYQNLEASSIIDFPDIPYVSIIHLIQDGKTNVQDDSSIFSKLVAAGKNKGTCPPLWMRIFGLPHYTYDETTRWSDVSRAMHAILNCTNDVRAGHTEQTRDQVIRMLDYQYAWSIKCGFAFSDTLPKSDKIQSTIETILKNDFHKVVNFSEDKDVQLLITNSQKIAEKMRGTPDMRIVLVNVGVTEEACLLEYEMDSGLAIVNVEKVLTLRQRSFILAQAVKLNPDLVHNL